MRADISSVDVVVVSKPCDSTAFARRLDACFMALQRRRSSLITFLAGCFVGWIIPFIFYHWLVTAPTYYGQDNRKAAPLHGVRKTLLVAVFTPLAEVPSTAKLVNETWGSGMTDYRIFFGGDSDFPSEWRRFPIMQLQHEQEFSSPQPTVRQLFSLVKFLHSKYIESYNWFLLASHKVYVSIRDLENLLNRLDPYAPVYLGKPGSQNPLEMASLRMLPNEYFCEGGPGIILSRAALEAIVPFLDECLQQVQSYSFNCSDVELGRCLSRNMDVHCSSSREVRIGLNSCLISKPCGMQEKYFFFLPIASWYNVGF